MQQNQRKINTKKTKQIIYLHKVGLISKILLKYIELPNFTLAWYTFIKSDFKEQYTG